jgi:dihydroflavonol-4-reductase
LGITDIVSLDIRDSEAFKGVSQDIDVLFHVAATYRFHTGGVGADQEMIKDSMDGVRSAMEAAKNNGIGKVVLTSSIATIPTVVKGQEPADETQWRTDVRVPYLMQRQNQSWVGHNNTAWRQR